MPALALALSLLIGPPRTDSLLWRAESLLARGRLAEARRIVERLEDRRPNDTAVLILLGRIHLAWPVVGRFPAESLFKRAARLDPANPEPFYYLGHVGLSLGGDDGEQIARRGLVPALAINPDYRDAWQLWSRLYRGPRERRDMIAALARHPGNRTANLRRAQLLVELRQYGEAVTLLDSLAGQGDGDLALRSLQARALFAAGRDSAGAEAYGQAVALADRDTANLLWRQLRGIATPRERATFSATPPSGRAAFLRRFWARREPDLSTPGNERLGEHFRRMEDARQHFTLLHPNSRYFRSPLYRALSGGVNGPQGPGVAEAYARAMEAQCDARLPGARDLPVLAGMGPRLDTTAAMMPNLEDSLDDRGRVFLRHGKPDYRLVHSLDSETWCYMRPDGTTLRVSFLRRTSGWATGGDMVVTPMMAGEAESARELLTTDRWSGTDDLRFAFWPAVFRAADRRSTELLVIPDSVWAVAALVDAEGRETDRDSATGRPLRLVAAPGSYFLLIDAARSGKSGRYRGSIPLPDFGTEQPAVSSVLLAPGATPAEREAMAAAAPHKLELRAAQPVRVYAELYDLGRRDGLSRWRAEYRFERLDGPVAREGGERSLSIAFEREQPYGPRIVESLVIDAGRLPRGRYRLYLEVVDQVLGVQASSAFIEFRLR